MSRSGTSGLAGLMKGRLIHFDILVSILDCLPSLFEERLEYSKLFVCIGQQYQPIMKKLMTCLWANIL